MSTTQQEANVAATTAIAMHAVTAHLLDHRLPAPLSISKPAYGEREIPVLLYLADAAAWLRTVTVDSIDEEPSGARAVVRRTHHVRLDNGIRVGLMTADPVAPWTGYSDECDAEEPVEPLGPQALTLAREHAFGGQS